MIALPAIEQTNSFELKVFLDTVFSRQLQLVVVDGGVFVQSSWYATPFEHPDHVTVQFVPATELLGVPQVVPDFPQPKNSESAVIIIVKSKWDRFMAIPPQQFLETVDNPFEQLIQLHKKGRTKMGLDRIENESNNPTIQYQPVSPEVDGKRTTLEPPRVASPRTDSASLQVATLARSQAAKALGDAYARLAFHEARLEIAREAASLPKAKEQLAARYGAAFAKALPERIRADQTAVRNELRAVAGKLREMGVDPKSVEGPLNIPVRDAVKFIKQRETIKNEAKSDRCDIARKAAKDFKEVSKFAKKAADVAPAPVAVGAKALEKISKGAAFVINTVCWGLDKSFVDNVDNMMKTLGYAPRS
ncbi:MAG: hypothetical protein HYY84_18320 [Deltaproteobacteria bacterium]|nr:hypothetical protein [Deltaproteobacteria bacterium]